MGDRKISMIGTLPPIKGVSPYTLNLVINLAKKVEIDFYGFKEIYPEFLYPGKSSKHGVIPYIKKVNIHNILTWYNPLSWFLVGFKINTKILHAQWWSWFLAPIYFVILIIAKLRLKKIIITMHNVIPHERAFYKILLNKIIIFLADVIIVHSKNNKETLIKELNIKKRIYVIPHGIIKIEKSKKKKNELLKKYGFSKKDKILIFFGNIREYKGIDILLEALYKFNDKNIKLIIAGQPWIKFDNYYKMIEKFDLKEHVKLFLNYNSEEKIAELFKIADVAVFPYKKFDAASGAASVALNFEKPMIVTDVGGLIDMVGDKKLIAIHNNSEDLMKKINYSLKNLKKIKIVFNKIKKLYLWNFIVKATLRVYNEC